MSARYTFKAWAIVNKESGRIMLIEVGAAPVRMEAPAIYMTRKAALHHKRDDEKLVRVEISSMEACA